MRWVLVFAAVMGVAGGSVWGDRNLPAPPAGWPAWDVDAVIQWPLPSEEDRAETSRLVRDLGSGNFAVREMASRELEDKGAARFPGLKEAVEASADPEVRSRTSSALAKVDLVRTSGLPTAFRKQFATYAVERERALSRREAEKAAPQSSRPASGTLDQVRFDSIWRDGSSGVNSEESRALALRIVLDHETDPWMRQLLEGSRANGLGTAVRLALVEGRPKDAEEILRRGLETNAEARGLLAAFLAQRDGRDFDADAALVKYQLKDPNAMNQLAYCLYRAKGDKERAADYAARLPADVSWRSVSPGLVEARRWRELAEFIEADPKREHYFMNEAVAYELAGDLEKADAILAPAIKDPNLFRQDRGNVLGSLLKADRAEAVIGITRQSSQEEETAVILLLQQMRVREALAAITDRKLVSLRVVEKARAMGFEKAAEALVRGIEPDEGKLGSKAAYYESGLAQEMERMGEKEKAEALRKKAYALVDAYAAKAKAWDEGMKNIQSQLQALQTNADPRDRVAQAQRSALMNEEMKLIPQQSELSRAQQSIRLIPEFVTNVHEIQSANIWYREIGKNQGLDARGQYDLTMRILRGEVSGEELLRAMPVAGFLSNSSLQSFYMNFLLEKLHEIGRDDLMLDVLRQWDQKERDPTIWARLGDIALERGAAAEAVTWYQRAAVFNVTDASLMYRTGLAMTRVREMREEGKELLAFVPWMVLGDQDRAAGVAQEMNRFEGAGVGDRWIDALADRLGVGRDSFWPVHLARERAAAEARGDYAEALELAKEGRFFPLIFNTSNEGEDYTDVIATVAIYHRARVLDGFARGDWKAVREGLEGELRNGPPDVGVMEKVWAGLVKGDKEGAEKIWREAEGRLKAVVEDYPEAGQYGELLKRVEALEHF